jgi:hypothetical protein
MNFMDADASGIFFGSLSTGSDIWIKYLVLKRIQTLRIIKIRFQTEAF